MNPIFFYESGNTRYKSLSPALKTNLLFYYKFQNNAVNSLTPGTLDGTSNNVVYTNGKIQVGAYFDSTSIQSYVEIPDNSALSFTSGGGVDIPFSISMWVKFDGFGATFSGLLMKRNNAAGEEYSIQYQKSSNTIRFGKYTSVPSVFQGVNIPLNATSGVWYHFAFTDDGSKTNAGMKIYLDGVLGTSTNNNSGTYTGMNNLTSPVRIASSWNLSANQAHMGRIDELGVWKNRVLTASEILEIYNGGLGTSY